MEIYQEFLGLYFPFSIQSAWLIANSQSFSPNTNFYNHRFLLWFYIQLALPSSCSSQKKISHKEVQMVFISQLNPYESRDIISRNPETPASFENLQNAIQDFNLSANGFVLNSSVNQHTKKISDRMGNQLHYQFFA